MALAPEIQKQIVQAAEKVVRTRYVTALVGAGLSVESGIPPFRGKDGLWTKYGEPDFRDYQRLLEDPKGWWERRLQATGPQEFRQAIETAAPNAGHHALAEMEREGLLQYVITQNIDNLHRAAGSAKVAEIHGNRTLLRCIRCAARYAHEVIPLDTLPPRCPACGGVMKSDTVMFGEPIPEDVLAVCQREASRSDCMLLLGTSGVVYPAAGLPTLARQVNRALLIEINPEETALSSLCDLVIRAPAGTALPALAEEARRTSRERRG